MEPRVTFDPPLSHQRAHFVYSTLKNEGIRSVIELGCGAGAILKILLRDGSFKDVAGVDINPRTINSTIYSCRPKEDEFFVWREAPTNLRLYKGDACEVDSRFANYEAVIASEMPLLMIITTPNKDFNVYLGTRYTSPSGIPVRHPEHLFEFSSAEFIELCSDKAKQHGYVAEFFGIGFLPEALSQEKTVYNSCSQACILRINIKMGSKNSQLKESSELVYSASFPEAKIHTLSHKNIVEELVYNMDALITNSYLEKNLNYDCIPYNSEDHVISLRSLIEHDKNCLVIKYSSCMTIPSIRAGTRYMETVKQAVLSKHGTCYFIKEDEYSFKILENYVTRVLRKIK